MEMTIVNWIESPAEDGAVLNLYQVLGLGKEEAARFRRPNHQRRLGGLEALYPLR